MGVLYGGDLKSVTDVLKKNCAPDITYASPHKVVGYTTFDGQVR